MGTVVVNYVFTPVHHPSHLSSFNSQEKCLLYHLPLGPISRILTFTLSHSQLSLSLFQVFLVSWSQIFFVNVFTETPLYTLSPTTLL